MQTEEEMTFEDLLKKLDTLNLTPASKHEIGSMLSFARLIGMTEGIQQLVEKVREENLEN